MTSILVWYLVSISVGSYNRGNVQYSPPLTTLEDCVRLKKFVDDKAVDSQCIQVKKAIEK
jgi:hypothetical protein